MEDNYHDLANAIVIQAVKDYRKALRKLNKHPHHEAALTTKLEAEQFFLSSWYHGLTNLNGERLVHRLQSETIGMEGVE
jgi:hypothetical protein